MQILVYDPVEGNISPKTTGNDGRKTEHVRLVTSHMRTRALHACGSFQIPRLARSGSAILWLVIGRVVLIAMMT